MSPLKLAILNLSRRPVPTLITIFAISISVACSGILLRLNQLSESRFSTLARGGDAIVGAKAGGIEILLGALNGEGEYPGYLPLKLFESLKANQSVQFEDGTRAHSPFIRAIIPLVYFARYNQFRIVGTDEIFFQRPNPEDSPVLVAGRWATGAGEIVTGSAFSPAELNATIDAQLWTGEHANPTLPLKVVGILAPTESAWDRMAYSNLITAQAALASTDLSQISIWGSQVLNYFLVYTHSGGFADLAALVNRRTVGQAVLVSQQKERLESLTGTGKKLGLFVTILILALSGLSVTAMLITRFDAMAVQLAVLRALGYKKTLIAQWLLWEGFLIGLLACGIGLVLDLMGFPMMRSLLSASLPPTDIVQSSLFQSLPIWITALTATTASVFIPLYRIYHQDVHFALRS